MKLSYYHIHYLKSDLINSMKPNIDFTKLSIEDILGYVAIKTGISKEKLKSKKRHKSIVFARNLFFGLARLNKKNKTEDVGSIVNRDHSTVTYAESQFFNKFDHTFKNYVENLGVDFIQIREILKEQKKIIKKNNQKKKQPIILSQIKELYYTEKMSFKELSEFYECSVHRIWYFFKTNNIKPRSNSESVINYNQNSRYE